MNNGIIIMRKMGDDMDLFQILDCSGTLATCCSNPALTSFLYVAKRIIDIIQIVLPMVLLIAGTIQFVQLTINPEMKNGFRKLLNKLMAAFFVFFIPILVDAVLGVVPNSVNLSSCWQQAKSINPTSLFGGHTYIEENDDKTSVVMDNEKYEELTKDRIEKEDTPTKTNTNTNSNKVSAKQKAIVAYAKKFLNKGYKYKYKGTWDCTGSYKPTDCSGFVKCVIKNTTGANIPRKANNMWKKRFQYFDVISEKNRQAGDIIYYGGTGHVGIYTGKGKEIIHNKGTGYGIVKDSNYNKASKHGKPVGFLRLKGVKE